MTDAPKVIWAWRQGATDWTDIVSASVNARSFVERDRMTPYIRASAPELAALAEALRNSQLQIEYLHERLGQNTGTGNAVHARNAAALAAWDALLVKTP